MFGRKPSRPVIGRLHHNLAELADIAQEKGQTEDAEAVRALSAAIAGSPEFERIFEDVVSSPLGTLRGLHALGRARRAQGTPPPVLPPVA